jgi:hypothetical protein
MTFENFSDSEIVVRLGEIGYNMHGVFEFSATTFGRLFMAARLLG